jgi:hypothetical protein
MPTTDVALRGLKGLWWEPHEYRGWPAFLASAGYNLLLVCYTAWPELSIRWRHGLSSAARSTLRALAHEATAAGIELGLALNPCIGTQSWAPATAAIRFHPGLTADWFAAYWRSRRAGQELAADPALRYDADADLADLLESCRAAAACGVRVLVLCLDDVEPPVGADPAWLGRAQARLVAAVRSWTGWFPRRVCWLCQPTTGPPACVLTLASRPSWRGRCPRRSTSFGPARASARRRSTPLRRARRPRCSAGHPSCG